MLWSSRKFFWRPRLLTSAAPKGATFSPRSPRKSVARYAKHNGNFVLVDSGSFEADGAHQFIEIVYDLLIEAIQLGSLVYFEFGVSAIGLE
jgi:hypothetical protein